MDESQTPSTHLAPLCIRSQYSGQHLFITGVTGFVGKVLLALVATELRDVRKVTVLVRTNKNFSDARLRFEEEVIGSPPFVEVAKRIGSDELHDWCQNVVDVVAGDITESHLGLTVEDYAALTETDSPDLILHCAGNVNFNPPLDQALAVNAVGVSHKVDFARAANCPLVHMSTTFVAGKRSNLVREDEPVLGYAPNGQPFDAHRELDDAIVLTRDVRRRAEDQALECRFRDEARAQLTKEGLDFEDVVRFQMEMEKFRRRWIDGELSREGSERAQRWGWTNTYTYTKSLGEKLTLDLAEKEGVQVSIVRPAIVESSLDFPFPGWNEGLNTCAPFVYVMYKGHRFVPSNPRNILDLVPVDYVCRGTIMAGASLLAGESGQVLQFCSGDANPLHMERAVELTNLAWRRWYDKLERNPVKRGLMRNLDSVTVDRKTYDAFSAPQVNRLAKQARKALDSIPHFVWGPAKPAVKGLQKGLRGVEKASRAADAIFDLFAPFVEENNPCFSSRRIRHLSTRLSDDERAVFGFDLTDLDWRTYWAEIHMGGLQKWVFGELDAKMRSTKKVAKARDLIEVFRTTTRANAERRALSLFGETDIALSYTYDEVWEGACRVASWLKAKGIRKGDAVLLISRNEPAWPMVYFGILLADGVVVPLDWEMPSSEVRRIARKADARLAIIHEDADLDLGISTVFTGDVFEAEPLEELESRDRSNDVASLLFTSGTTGDPKGVVLTHSNFTALLASLHGTFDVTHRDRFLSVLPLFHTFEFSCGFLMPLSKGAHILYLANLEGQHLRSALRQFRPSGLIGVPALWDVLHRRIESQVRDRGQAAHLAFTAMLRFSRFLRTEYGVNLGPMAFSEVHRMLGGKIRHLISGGAALSDPVLDAFEGLGFELLEGYGLTEAAPVLSVRRPGDRNGSGSVGPELPGVQLQIFEPDASGVGEVIARGDNVMAGYLDDEKSTQESLRDGWLHTGDLGKLDESGRLTLVGRRKEIIVTSGGKNVYPDELEPLYGDDPLVDELCIVGIPDRQGDERVAALVVPVQSSQTDLRAKIKDHFTRVGTGLSEHQRIRTIRFWHGSLPRTATRKVKRNEVRAELMKLIDADRSARRLSNELSSQREPAWVYGSLGTLTDIPAMEIGENAHLISDLGLSSLQLMELRLMLEERGNLNLDAEAFIRCETVADVVALSTGESSSFVEGDDPLDPPTDLGFKIPSGLSDIGQSLLGRGQKLAFDQLFNIRTRGRENIPVNQQVIVVSNHCSHLDVGVVKHALGDYGARLATLAARDYFFDTPIKRDLLESLTHLIPVERTGSLEHSLSHAVDAMNNGRVVLVFPEGTRSQTGVLQPFKQGIGYLQAKSNLSVLPLFVRGTHGALPKGSVIPKKRSLSAVIGPVVPAQFLKDQTEGRNRLETYTLIAQYLEMAVKALRDDEPYPWLTSNLKARRDTALESLFDELPERFCAAALPKPLTWYFSLGTGSAGKWTLCADEGGAIVRPGRPDGQADCVLKTDVATFTRICRESYVPSFAEFTDGRVKTNDPELLMTFKSVFDL